MRGSDEYGPVRMLAYSPNRVILPDIYNDVRSDEDGESAADCLRFLTQKVFLDKSYIQQRAQP